MQKTQSKITRFFLQTLVTGAEVAEIKTSFLEILCSCLYNGPFCCSCSTLLNSNHVPLRPNSFGFNHYSFWLQPA